MPRKTNLHLPSPQRARSIAEAIALVDFITGFAPSRLEASLEVATFNAWREACAAIERAKQ